MFRIFKTRRSLTEQVFQGRQAQIEEVSFTEHFQQCDVPAIISGEVKRILEEQLGTDLSRLRSSDDFSSNLSFFFKLDSMADVAIVDAIEEHFKISVTDQEAQDASSIEDIVLLVNRKLEERDGV